MQTFHCPCIAPALHPHTIKMPQHVPRVQYHAVYPPPCAIPFICPRLSTPAVAPALHSGCPPTCPCATPASICPCPPLPAVTPALHSSCPAAVPALPLCHPMRLPLSIPTSSLSSAFPAAGQSQPLRCPCATPCMYLRTPMLCDPAQRLLTHNPCIAPVPPPAPSIYPRQQAPLHSTAAVRPPSLHCPCATPCICPRPSPPAVTPPHSQRLVNHTPCIATVPPPAPSVHPCQQAPLHSTAAVH